ncbi:hypothetical protein Lsai_2508 [Legionella sainthelensi]|uniref:Uncharacterized protein n=1 Tax=Legionella sainthelensi TaxID=28087 RepID=A0A0W0YE56_9GAMM|nr:hypothetical protein [Legionella sainthelensi]KTD54916.1 hypothetical protein Lsai_2508 [Legionella sainthelensi]VEH37342.1 Uncharacterised protein [Legionella sainthelensi]
MFTQKQTKLFEEYLDSTTVNDLFTPDLPIIEFPSWLHPEIIGTLEHKLNKLEEQKNSPARLYFDFYSMLVFNFKRLIPLFTNSRMQPIWADLCNHSIEITIEFIRSLFCYENHYDGGIRLLEKQNDEIQSCKRMIKQTEKLHDAMEEYQCHYYGHMIQDNHNELMELLVKFKDKTVKSLGEFKESPLDGTKLFSEHWPMTRKCTGENALAIFFSRKIYYFFQTKFNKPMYNYIAEIVGVIFNCSFSDNQIIKLCKVMKPFICDNSTY